MTALIDRIAALDRARIAARYLTEQAELERIAAESAPAETLPADRAAAAFQPSPRSVSRAPAFRQTRRRRAEPVTVSYLPGFGPNSPTTT